jgi:hypothetical protein
MSASDFDAKPEAAVDVCPSSSQRLAVKQRYEQLLIDQASQPDKIFVDGYELQDLDSNMVVLDKDTQEHPRVRSHSQF